jgi:hypothetical protein
MSKSAITPKLKFKPIKPVLKDVIERGISTNTTNDTDLIICREDGSDVICIKVTNGKAHGEYYVFDGEKNIFRGFILNGEQTSNDVRRLSEHQINQIAKKYNLPLLNLQKAIPKESIMSNDKISLIIVDTYISNNFNLPVAEGLIKFKTVKNTLVRFILPINYAYYETDEQFNIACTQCVEYLKQYAGPLIEWAVDSIVEYNEIEKGLVEKYSKGLDNIKPMNSKGTFTQSGIFQYPGDPISYPLIQIETETEKFNLYHHGIVSIMKKDSSGKCDLDNVVRYLMD